VYRITNLLTGKSYIGSSIDLGRRFMNYYSVNSLLKATGMAICRALLKYGGILPLSVPKGGFPRGRLKF